MPDIEYPLIVRGREWVAVMFYGRGPWHVITADGHHTEVYTLPDESASQLLFQPVRT